MGRREAKPAKLRFSTAATRPMDLAVADDPLGERLLQPEDPLAVGGEQARLGQAGHLGHHPGHLGGAHRPVPLAPGAAAGQVEHRHRLVGQEAVGDVAGGEGGGRLQRLGARSGRAWCFS